MGNEDPIKQLAKLTDNEGCHQHKHLLESGFIAFIAVFKSTASFVSHPGLLS